MDSKRPSIKSLDILFLTFFGSGLSPVAPGTAGTIATLPFLYLAMVYQANIYIFGLLVLVLTVISCFVADRTQKRLNVHDPGWIVIDEVCGMSIAFLFIKEANLIHLLVLFILFRFFDIVKIWPACYFDKKIKHGAGTILDDVVSGIFAGVVYFFGIDLIYA